MEITSNIPPLADLKGTSSADNANSDVTLAAPGSGFQIGITRIEAGFSVTATADKLLTVVEDTGGAATTIYQRHISGNSQVINFDPALPVADNKNVRVRLAASGTGAVLGIVNVTANSYRK